MEVPGFDNNRLEILRMLHQGEDPQQNVERRLQQHEEAFQREAARITAAVEERQASASRRGGELVGEMGALDVHNASELQVDAIKETLKQAFKTQKELEKALQDGQERLKQLKVEKVELIQSQENLRRALKSPDAKGSVLQDHLYGLGESLNGFISEKIRGKDEYTAPPVRRIPNSHAN